MPLRFLVSDDHGRFQLDRWHHLFVDLIPAARLPPSDSNAVTQHDAVKGQGWRPVSPRPDVMAYQRGSERRRDSPPPNPPAYAGFGRASLTERLRPPS